MIIELDTTGTIIALEKILTDFSKKDTVKSIMVLAGNNKEFIPEKLDPVLRKISVPIIGGLFPAVMHNNIFLEVGTIVVGLPKAIENFVIHDLNNEDIDLDSIVEDISLNKSTSSNETFFVFIDGAAGQLGQLVDSLFSIFGVINSFIGGGAGEFYPNTEMVSKPCVFTNDGLFSDSAVIGVLQTKSEMCVSHGFKKISDSYRVTNTREKQIISIDWEPAIEPYIKVLEKDSGIEITKENFFEVNEYYSLGIERIGGNIVVRQVITYTDDGSLTFIVPIPNESLVCVLKSDSETMLEDVKLATTSFYKELNHKDDSFLFLVDCVSRYHLLGDDFKKELALINRNDVPLVGVLSLSEIANTGTNYIESYNRTFVIGLLKC